MNVICIQNMYDHARKLLVNVEGISFDTFKIIIEGVRITSVGSIRGKTARGISTSKPTKSLNTRQLRHHNSSDHHIPLDQHTIKYFVEDAEIVIPIFRTS